MILVTKILRRSFIRKILQCETRKDLFKKSPMVVVILLTGLGALFVGSNIWVGAMLERMVVLHVLISVKR